MIRVPALQLVGAKGTHRSGWPFAMAALQPLLSPDGLLLDDFVERTFLYGVPPGSRRSCWQEPWIGIVHHPQHMPPYFLPTKTLQALEAVPEFQRARAHLIGVIALSEYLAGWIREHWQVPAAAIKHPTDQAAPRFSLEAWLRRPQVAQVGWYLRNPDAILQLAVPHTIRKLFVIPNNRTLPDATKHIRAGSPTRHRPKVGRVHVTPHLPAVQYDAMLSSSVVLGEYFDASASNTLIECMARHTPILVNRLPAHEEYLGRDYPLFYERFEDAGALLTPDRVEAAHAYLAARPVPWMTGEAWRADVEAFVRLVRPRQEAA